MSNAKCIRLLLATACVCLIMGFWLGSYFHETAKTPPSEGFCDAMESIGKNTHYPVNIEQRYFVASASPYGLAGIYFPPCGRALNFAGLYDKQFATFRDKAVKKRNTIYVSGKVSGAVIWLGLAGGPAFRPIIVSELRETNMPQTLQ